MKKIHAINRRAACVLCAPILLLCAGGCLNLEPAPDPTRFYVLSPSEIPEPANVRTVSDAPSVGVSQIELPEALDRSQMAIRAEPHEYRYSEYHLWAEPLGDAIAGRLAKILKRELKTPRVYAGSWPPSESPEVILNIDMLRFEGTGDREAVLVAQWRIQSRSPGEFSRHGTSSYSGPFPSEDYHALAESLNSLLERFGRDLAGAILAD